MRKGGLKRGELYAANKHIQQLAKQKQQALVQHVQKEVSKRDHKGGTKYRKILVAIYTDVYNGPIHECTYCGCDIDSRDPLDYTRDHLVPLNMGGADNKANSRPACFDCNQQKGGFTLEEWLNIMAREFERTGSNNAALLYKIMRTQGVLRYAQRMGDKLYK